MAEPAAPLKTPTDIKSNAAKSVAEALNGILADSFALYSRPRTSTGTYRARTFATIT